VASKRYLMDDCRGCSMCRDWLKRAPATTVGGICCCGNRSVLVAAPIAQLLRLQDPRRDEGCTTTATIRLRNAAAPASPHCLRRGRRERVEAKSSTAFRWRSIAPGCSATILGAAQAPPVQPGRSLPCSPFSDCTHARSDVTPDCWISAIVGARSAARPAALWDRTAHPAI
jgi:hypothetical protein